MISYVKGTLEEVGNDHIIVDVNDIGYQVKVSLRVIEAMPAVGTVIKIYTYTYVREDMIALYGFLTKEDLNMFLLILGVNGVGPKGALSILSVFSAYDLQMAILSADARTIAKAPGIGAKTAQRLLLELKDKISMEEAMEQFSPVLETTGNTGSIDQERKDAVEALTALGYSPQESLKAIKAVEITEEMSSEQILKAALKHLF